MTFKHAVPVGLVSIFIGFTVACSGGSNSGPSGRACTTKQEKTFVIPETAAKVSLKPEDKKIPTGHYVYDRAEMLYVYKPDLNDKQTWVLIQTVEYNYANKREPAVGVYCVRGISPSTPSFGVTSQGVSEMKSYSDGSLEFTTRAYSFDWDTNEAKLEAKVSAADDSFDSPTKVYEQESANFNFYKLVQSKPNDNRYEILSVKEYPKENLTVYLKILLLKADLPVTKPADDKPDANVEEAEELDSEAPAVEADSPSEPATEPAA